MTVFESPNYTQVPNDLFDKLLPLMGNAELRIVLWAVRQTFGYHRSSDEISLSQFQKATGLSRQGVVDGIAAAIERGVMREIGEGKRGVKRYALVVSVDQSRTPTSQASRPDVEGATSQASRLTKEKEKKAVSDDTGKPTEKRIPTAVMTPMKNAIAAAFGWETPTKAEWGRIQKVAKELVLAGLSSSDVAGLYGWCARQSWPSFSPNALAQHVSDWRGATNGNDHLSAMLDATL